MGRLLVAEVPVMPSMSMNIVVVDNPVAVIRVGSCKLVKLDSKVSYTKVLGRIVFAFLIYLPWAACWIAGSDRLEML
ncbi:hypothetical protein V6N12_060835 [Hibiscus sabdariffa]|uniref:Uncharacterized protein n=1 Tax=Hibiscus sabdariffa TaxID=183260 RepID=A0ABR2D8E5_9ROSI